MEDTEEMLYRMKYHELLNKFSPEFQKKLRINPMANVVFDTLNHGGNHFALFEQLLDVVDKQSGELIKLYGNQPPAPRMVECSPEALKEIMASNENLLRNKTFFEKIKILFNVK